MRAIALVLSVVKVHIVAVEVVVAPVIGVSIQSTFTFFIDFFVERRKFNLFEKACSKQSLFQLFEITSKTKRYW